MGCPYTDSDGTFPKDLLTGVTTPCPAATPGIEEKANSGAACVGTELTSVFNMAGL